MPVNALCQLKKIQEKLLNNIKRKLFLLKSIMITIVENFGYPAATINLMFYLRVRMRTLRLVALLRFHQRFTLESRQIDLVLATSVACTTFVTHSYINNDILLK